MGHVPDDALERAPDHCEVPEKQPTETSEEE